MKVENTFRRYFCVWKLIFFELVPAIEKYWWSAKNYFNKRVMARAADPEAEDLDDAGFRKLVLESVNSIPVDKVLRLCTSNRRYVAQVLKSQVNQAQ